MAFFEKQKGTFISVMDGQFCMRVSEDHPKAKARKLEKGKNKGTIVHEFRFDGCEGLLKGVNIKQSKGFSDELQLFIHDSDEGSDYPDFILTVPINSRHAKSFVAAVGNIDLEKPISFEPFKFPAVDQETKKPIVSSVTGEQKQVIGWQIKQDDEKVERTLDKDDIPEMVQIKKGGKTEWDDSEAVEFLTAHLKQWAEENNMWKSKAPAPTKKNEDEDDAGVDDENDEIPF